MTPATVRVCALILHSHLKRPAYIRKRVSCANGRDSLLNYSVTSNLSCSTSERKQGCSVS